jgi:hypothetical protein
LMQLQFSIDKTSTTAEADRLSPRVSAWEVVKRVYREEGILSFWRGEIIIFIYKCRCTNRSCLFG